MILNNAVRGQAAPVTAREWTGIAWLPASQFERVGVFYRVSWLVLGVADGASIGSWRVTQNLRSLDAATVELYRTPPGGDGLLAEPVVESAGDAYVAFRCRRDGTILVLEVSPGDIDGSSFAAAPPEVIGMEAAA